VVEHLVLKAPPRRKDTRRERAIFAGATQWYVGFEHDSLAVYRWGDGPAVLLVHGWGGSSGQMTAFVEPLRQAGFSVVAFDAPGHGASTGNWLAIPRFAGALAAVARVHGPLHSIIAHSLGGPAALVALSSGVPAGRATLIGPPADARAWFDTVSRELGLSDEVARLARGRIDARVGVGFDQLNAQAFGPSVLTPTLVIHDENDREVAFSDGAAVARALPHATFVSTSGLGHRRILRDPKVIARTVAFTAEHHARPRLAIVASSDRGGS
jgi:pimeloyl-ACP methyl ester carboxylesterase